MGPSYCFVIDYFNTGRMGTSQLFPSQLYGNAVITWSPNAAYLPEDDTPGNCASQKGSH